MENVHEEEYKGMSISIIQDEHGDSPDCWGDNNLFLVGYHRDFSVDAPKVYRILPEGVTRSKDDKGYTMFSKEELVRYFQPDEVCPKCESDNIEARADKHYCFSCEKSFSKVKLLKPDVFNEYHVIPLSAYIHSGVKLYLGKHSVCQWDSCQVGAVLVAKSEAKTLKQAQKYAEGLIKNWNDFMNGNVYGYTIQDENGVEVDSCWGFYGEYDKTGGALVEAKEYINNVTNKGITDSKGQLLFNYA